MRLTSILYFRRFRQRPFEKMKKLHWWKTGKHMMVRDLKLPIEVENKLFGERVENMMRSKRYEDVIMREIDFVDDHWTPPVNLHDYLSKPSLQEDEAFMFQVGSRFVSGEKQAAILTKCSVIHALPVAHEEAVLSIQLPTDANQLLENCVMRSHVWANDGDKLPRRYFPHLPIWRPKREFGIMPKNQSRYLLTDVLRYADKITQSINTDSVADRMTARDMDLSSHYTWRSHRIYFKSTYDIAICGRSPLPIIESDISTAHQLPLPDISPLSPLIDLKLSRDYGANHHVGMKGIYHHPHLVFVNIADLPLEWNSFAEPEAFYTTQEQKNAIGIMSAFSVALASAHQRFGSDMPDGILPEPIVSQVVCCDGVHLDFVCFQLNTLDFSSDDGVQNIAWVDGGHALFEKRLRNRAMLRELTFHNLNPDVFKKLLSMYRFGLNSVMA